MTEKNVLPEVLRKIALEPVEGHNEFLWSRDIPPAPKITMEFFIMAPCHEDGSYYLYNPNVGQTYLVDPNGILRPMEPPKLTLWQRFVRWWRQK